MTFSAKTKPSAGSTEGGFTLLEVMVALAIAAPALAILYSQGLQAVSVGRTAASYQEAITRAQSRLDTLTGDALIPEERDGDDGGGFHWRTVIVQLASVPSSRPAALGGPPSMKGAALYAVNVRLSWTNQREARSFSLDTRRLGPAIGDPP